MPNNISFRIRLIRPIHPFIFLHRVVYRKKLLNQRKNPICGALLGIGAEKNIAYKLAFKFAISIKCEGELLSNIFRYKLTMQLFDSFAFASIYFALKYQKITSM